MCTLPTYGDRGGAKGKKYNFLVHYLCDKNFILSRGVVTALGLEIRWMLCIMFSLFIIGSFPHCPGVCWVLHIQEQQEGQRGLCSSNGDY